MEHQLFQVSINGVTHRYHVLETDAPKDYDGFGTFALAEWTYDKVTTRTVMVMEEHYTWQTARYSSGMHTAKPSDFAPEDIADYLWKRIQGNVGYKVVEP